MQDYFTFSLQNVGICMKYGYFFAKFPNKNAPNSQTELRQMTEHNCAKLPSKFAPNYRLKFKKIALTLAYIKKKQYLCTRF